MSYGSQVVPTLLDMLADPKEDRAWKNIVIVLGMLGDERAMAPLISLIEQSAGGEITHSQYEAKKAALLGLGYLINKAGNERALRYLRGGVVPSVWPQRGVSWASPNHETATERNRELSRLAIIGLGLSGNPSAEDALRELLAPAATATETAFREQMSGVISEALKANQRISDEGLAEYYRAATP
jgi:HEAT repeat protein